MSDFALPVAAPASRLFPGTGACCLRRYPVCAGEGEEQVAASPAAASKVRAMLWFCHVPGFVPGGWEAHRSLPLVIAEGQQGDAPAEWAEQERT
jgi:hypothetical protein